MPNNNLPKELSKAIVEDHDILEADEGPILIDMTDEDEAPNHSFVQDLAMNHHGSIVCIARWHGLMLSLSQLTSPRHTQ